MDKLRFKPLLDVVNDYDAFLFDLWGVIVEGTEIYAGVVDVINQISARKKVFFVSNAPRPKGNALERLKSWGLKTTEDAIFTSGEISRQILLASSKKLNIDNPAIYHLGDDRNFDILTDLDFNVTKDIAAANILLLTLYRDEGEDLNEFDNLLKSSAKKNMICICANPDTIIPYLGFKRYCSGYFAEKYEQFGGKVIYTGKPHIEIYDQVLSTITDIPKSRILMIGDTLDTDILGARNAGIHSALVMTGNAEKFHLSYEVFDEKLSQLHKASQESGIMPTFVTRLVS